MSDHDELLRLAKAANLTQVAVDELHWFATSTALEQLIRLARAAGMREAAEICSQLVKLRNDEGFEDRARAVGTAMHRILARAAELEGK